MPNQRAKNKHRADFYLTEQEFADMEELMRLLGLSNRRELFSLLLEEKRQEMRRRSCQCKSRAEQ